MRLKRTCSNVECQKIFRGGTLGPPLHEQGKASEGREEGKGEGKEGEGDGGEGEWGSPTHHFRLKSCTGIQCIFC